MRDDERGTDEASAADAVVDGAATHEQTTHGGATDAADPSPASPYAVSLEALERGARVPPEEQFQEVDADPSDAGVWDGELYRRQHDALRAGG